MKMSNQEWNNKQQKVEIKFVVFSRSEKSVGWRENNILGESSVLLLIVMIETQSSLQLIFRAGSTWWRLFCI